jgi:hypothetical protein
MKEVYKPSSDEAGGLNSAHVRLRFLLKQLETSVVCMKYFLSKLSFTGASRMYMRRPPQTRVARGLSSFDMHAHLRLSLHSFLPRLSRVVIIAEKCSFS